MSSSAEHALSTSPLVEPPRRVPWLLRPMIWIAARITGKDPLPARLLAHFPKGAVGAGALELAAASAPGDMEGRILATVRIVASAVAGCPFCIDMNAATWKRAGLSVFELRALLDGREEDWPALGAREHAAARYASALSRTPVELDEALTAELTARFSPREIVVLAATIAQVNYWSRFNQGLGVPAAGFFDESACPAPGSSREAPAKPTIA